MKTFVEIKAEKRVQQLLRTDPRCWMVAVDYYSDDGEDGSILDREVIGWID